MRTLAICFTICLVAFLAFSEYRRVEDRKIKAAEDIAKQLAAAEAELSKVNRSQPAALPVASSAPASRRTWTYMPQTGRYVEHDSSVSAMQSLGGGGGPRPTPKPAADAEIKKAWGFGKTKLDEPVRR